MTKHFCTVTTASGELLHIDAGYERGLHAAYLNVYDAHNKLVYDDNVQIPIGTMRPADVASVLQRRYGVQLPDGMLEAIQADYDGHVAPYTRQWPEGRPVSPFEA